MFSSIERLKKIRAVASDSKQDGANASINACNNVASKVIPNESQSKRTCGFSALPAIDSAEERQERAA
jgi:hypothetical protein